MTWTPLADRIDDLPLILAGPVLRQVTQTSVTVWIALRKAADVTLTIFSRDSAAFDSQLGSGRRPTVAVGKSLHVVAVTALIPQFPTPLREGVVYFYDMRFDGPTATKSSLREASTRPSRLAGAELVYAPFKLPSFVLPPADLNKLRLIHGSCRKPNGGAKDDPTHQEPPDALGMLDLLIEDTASKPFDRPHQLFLTGDQIYADEVADVLLLMLTDAGNTLMGWEEELPKGRNEANIEGGPYVGAQLPPSTRTDAMRHARFTTQDTRSHLMTMAEFLTMYLFVWSDELWDDSSSIPTVAQVKAAVARLPGASMSREVEADAEVQRKAVVTFCASIKKVRRALANIPSYMICDDHEITDDWNMTRRFCETVYDNPLGIRIIQNGLIAFAICQAWGNKPEQFWKDSQAAGTKLLSALEAATRGGKPAYSSLDAEIRPLLGIHPVAGLKARPVFGVFHDRLPMITVQGAQVSATSIVYHFTVEGPSHQVIVTDTRTWRSFPIPGLETHADLLNAEALHQQFVQDPPPLNGRLLLVVTTTNIPPIASVREAAFIGGAANYYKLLVPSTFYRFSANAIKKFIYDNDLLDSWEFPDATLDRLFVAITSKFAPGTVLSGQAIFMSGDVHFAFASRLAYWADASRLDDAAGAKQKAKAVFAQLVASAFKNEKGATRGLQKKGYGYTPKDWQAKITWTHEPTGYIGWNVSPNAGERKVGRIDPGLIRSGITLRIHGKSPTLFAQMREDNEFHLDEKPDFRYRLDYLPTTSTGQTFDPTSMGGKIILENRKGAATTWANAGRAHRDLIDSAASPPEVVGFNSLCDVTFVWQRADGTPAASPNDPLATNRRVRQTVRWEQRGVEFAPRWAMYDVSLNPDDPAYPRIVAKNEP